jgi:hypothetical protein
LSANASNVKLNDMELLEELVLGSARGGRRVAESGPLAVSIVRSLTAADVPALMNPPVVGSKPKAPLQLRHSHHQIARYVAAGKPDSEIALITGYCPSYICNLKLGQDFKDLIAYYATQKDQIFVDVMERMKAVGLNTLDEIQRQFEENPDSFTTQQKMDLVELMLVKPMKAQAAVGGAVSIGSGASGVTVNVQFVKAEALPAPESGAESIEMLDITPERIER